MESDPASRPVLRSLLKEIQPSKRACSANGARRSASSARKTATAKVSREMATAVFRSEGRELFGMRLSRHPYAILTEEEECKPLESRLPNI